MINDYLCEGCFPPTNSDGERISKNVYAKTREECEEKLAVLMIEIKAEKERRKNESA